MYYLSTELSCDRSVLHRKELFQSTATQNVLLSAPQYYQGITRQTRMHVTMGRIQSRRQTDAGRHTRLCLPWAVMCGLSYVKQYI
jgi:hypothetical protein